MEKFDKKAVGSANADAQVKLIRKLQAIRKERGIQVSDVAREMGVDPTMVYRFERGGTNYTAATLRKYAKAVGAVLDFDADKAPDTELVIEYATPAWANRKSEIYVLRSSTVVRATLAPRSLIPEPPVDHWRTQLEEQKVARPVKGQGPIEAAR